MRIIGGERAGRCFDSRGFTGRPTTNMAKQALFNILANRYRFENLRVLDLFAGTGAIGFEFLSRGSSVVLVASNRKAASELARNAREMGFSRAEVRTSAFDLIFADPPYDLPLLREIPLMVANANLLEAGGLLIVEHRQRSAMAVPPDEKRQYGDSVFSFYTFPLQGSSE